MAGFLSNLRSKIGAALPWNKPRDSIKFPASTTGFDARELSHSPLEQEVKQRLNAPKLTSRNTEVVGRQYVRSIDDMVHHQPPVHTEMLVKHITKEGAWGLGEKGSSYFADYMVNNPQLRDAVHRALTSNSMVSLAKEHGTRGYVRNTRPRTAVDVLFENQLAAGNHFYDALINDRYRGFEIRSLIRRAKQMDSEAESPREEPANAVQQEPEPMQQFPVQQPDGEPMITLSQARSLLEAARSGPITMTNDNSNRSMKIKKSRVGQFAKGKGMNISGQGQPEEAGFDQLSGQVAALRKMQGQAEESGRQQDANDAASAFFSRHNITDQQHQVEILTAIHNSKDFEAFKSHLLDRTKKYNLEANQKKGKIPKAEALFTAFKNRYAG